MSITEGSKYQAEEYVLDFNLAGGSLKILGRGKRQAEGKRGST